MEEERWDVVEGGDPVYGLDSPALLARHEGTLSLGNIVSFHSVELLDENELCNILINVQLYPWSVLVLPSMNDLAHSDPATAREPIWRLGTCNGSEIADGIRHFPTCIKRRSS